MALAAISLPNWDRVTPDSEKGKAIDDNFRTKSTWFRVANVVLSNCFNILVCISAKTHYSILNGCKRMQIDMETIFSYKAWCLKEDSFTIPIPIQSTFT